MEAQLREALNTKTKTELYCELQQEYVKKNISVAQLKNGVIKRDKMRLSKIDEALKEASRQPSESEIKAEILSKVRETKEAEAKAQHATRLAGIDKEISEIEGQLDRQKELDKGSRFQAVSRCAKKYVDAFLEIRTQDNEITSDEESVVPAVNRTFLLNFFKGLKEYENAGSFSETVFCKIAYCFKSVLLYIIVAVLSIITIFMDGVFFKEILLTIAFLCSSSALHCVLSALKYNLISDEFGKKPWFKIPVTIASAAVMFLMALYMVATMKQRLWVGIFGFIIGFVIGAIVVLAVTEDSVGDSKPITRKEKEGDEGAQIANSLAESANKISGKYRQVARALKNQSVIHKFSTYITELLDSPGDDKEIAKILSDYFSAAKLAEYTDGKGGSSNITLYNKLKALESDRKSEVQRIKDVLESIKNNTYDKEVQRLFEERGAGTDTASLQKEKEKLNESIANAQRQLDAEVEDVKRIAEKMKIAQSLFVQKIDSDILGRIDRAIALGFADKGSEPSELVTLQHNMAPVIITYTKSLEENNGAELSGIEALVYHMFWGCVFNSMRETRFNLIDEMALFSNLFYKPDINSANQSGYIKHSTSPSETTAIVSSIISQKSALTGKIAEYNKLCIEEMRSLIPYDILIIAGNTKLLNDKDFVRILNNTENWGIVPVLVLHDELFEQIKGSKYAELAEKNQNIYKLSDSVFKDKFKVQSDYITK